MEVIVQELLRFIAGKFIAYINKNGVIVQELLRFIAPPKQGYELKEKLSYKNC